MNQLIEEIVQDLYALDKELITYDTHVRKIVAQLIEKKPDTQFDDAFKSRLRSEIMQKVEEMRAQEESSVKNSMHDGGFMKNFFTVRWMYTAPVFAAMIAVMILGYGQYTKNGGIYLTKQHVQFALVPTQADVVGVMPETHFTLRSSKNISVATVEKIVSFDPATNFTVKKNSRSVSLAPSAFAAEGDSENNLAYQYEIIPTQPLEEDHVYKIAVRSDHIADRDYQWAFHVKAPFGVVSSTPDNKSTDVPLNTGIEMQFNRQLPSDVSHYFSITPEVQGDFDVHGDRLHFHPHDLLAQKTVYTVTVAKGVTATDDGDVSEKDYVFAFETGSEEQEDGSVSDLFFDLNEQTITVTPDMHPMIDVLYDTDGMFDVSVYKLDSMEDYIHRATLQTNWDLTWTNYHEKNDLSLYKPQEDHKILSVQGNLIATGEQDMRFDVPQNLPNGYYFFTITKDGVTQSGWIVSSDIAQYYSFAYDHGMMWIYNFMEKKPLEDAQIILRDDENNGVQIGKTDANGLALFTTPNILNNDSENTKTQFFVITPTDGMPVAVNISSLYHSKPDGDSHYWSYISTDKNKYHKTDKINYWGVVKSRKNHQPIDSVEVGLYDYCPYNTYVDDTVAEPIIVQDLPLSDFDTISGQLSLDDLPASSYCLAVVDRAQKETISTQYISVESYQKPAYNISVTPSVQSIYAGEEMTFDVRAAFYDGAPVSSQTLKYTLAGNDVLDGEIILDDAGYGQLRYTPQYDDSVMYYPQDMIATFFPTVTEEGDIYGRTHVNVFGPRTHITAESKNTGNNQYEISAEINAITFDNNILDSGMISESFLGEPVSGQSVDAELIKITYEKKETGEYYDYITKTQKKIYEYEQKEESIEKFSGKTNEEGWWIFTKTLQTDSDVSYKIVFKSDDRRGRVSKTEVYVYAGMSEDQPIALKITGGKDSDEYYYPNERDYSYGDTVTLSLVANDQDRSLDNKMLIYRYQNDIDRVELVQGNTYQEEFTEDLSPSVSYRAVILTQYGFEESYDVIASALNSDHALHVDVTPSKEKYRPGEKVEMDIHVVDAQGNPVSAEVNISVVDEALFQNNQDWNEEILNKVYRRISASLASAYTQYVKRSGGDMGGGGGGDDRSSFVDTAHFENVVTNADGDAHVAFEMPDNLTGWRVMARAFDTEHTAAGQTHVIVAASLPFFVDVNLSDRYLSGDEPQMKVRFFGEKYDNAQPVTYSVVSDQLHINETKTTSDPTNDFTLGKMQAGEYSITITAVQGEYRDSLVRKILVVDNASQKYETQMYTVTSDLRGVKNDGASYADIVFMDVGKAKFHNAVIQQAGDFGVRLDQIIATHVAQSILAMQYDHNQFSKELSLDSYEGGEDGTGLKLLPYSSPDLELSAKIADIIPQNMRKNDLRSFFEGCMYDDVADIHRTAQALYGLAALGEDVLYQVHVVQSFDKELTIDDKIYLALALYKNGDIEGARQYYNEEIKEHIIVENEQFAWIGSSHDGLEKEKLTATLGVLVSYINDRPMAEKLWKYMETHDPQRDLIDLEKMMMVASEMNHISQEKASCTVSTSKREFSVDLSDDQEKRMHMSQDELTSLRFNNITGDMALIVLHAFPVEKERGQENSPSISLKRSYEVDGKQTNIFKGGDLVTVRLTPTFTADAENGGYQIIDVLPSGLKLTTAVYNPFLFITDSENEQNDCDRIWYVDRMDDNRVVFSFDSNYAKEHNCKTFSIRYYARVSSGGVFNADRATIQSVQNGQKYFVTDRDQVTIQ